jgi:hypothetical protein
VGTIGAYLWLSRFVDRFLDVLPLVRITTAALLAGALSILAGLYSNVFGQWLVSILVYFSVLVVSRELVPSDWSALKTQLFAHRPREER